MFDIGYIILDESFKETGYELVLFNDDYLIRLVGFSPIRDTEPYMDEFDPEYAIIVPVTDIFI